MVEATRPLLSVRDLKMHFPITAGLLRRRVGAVARLCGAAAMAWTALTKEKRDDSLPHA